MTVELGILIGFTLFLSLLFVFSVIKIRDAYRHAMESVVQDKKALQSLLKDAQNRIHAATLQDYLSLTGRDLAEKARPSEPLRRNDAIEAEIASRVPPGI